jgi:ABC-2 type transport system permease protein
MVAAEVLKVVTAWRTPLILALSMMALTALGAAAISNDAAARGLEDPESDIVDVAGIGTFLALIVGILVVTWDYRHGTIVQTFLAEPRRERVMGAKLAVGIACGLLLVTLALLPAVVVAEIWLGDDFDAGGLDWMHVARLLGAAALWAVIGLGLGATLQTQVGALMAALIWFLIVENIFAGLGDWAWNVGSYLPGHVLDQFAVGSESDELGHRKAGLLGAGYAVLFAAAGLVAVLRRDVA